MVLYLGACAILYAVQRSLIYYPQPRSAGASMTILKLPVADANVLVSVRPHDGPKALIYFGGNAEDVSRNLPAFSQAFPDHSIYLLHYRGYGGSSGSPSEESIQRDAMALFDKVHAEHPQTAVVGRSLGSGVAVHLASQRPASRLILITPYDSLQEIAARHFPHMPVKWLLRDKFESWRYAPRVAVPTLLMAAEHDEVIPRSSTERLYACFAKGVASLQVIPGTGHNTISESPQYLEMIRAALSGAPAASFPPQTYPSRRSSQAE
ncbi:MAG TPA: alpha/beta fold hydrolase [Thermoanaerobaculia bacterium]|jgi:hypothetical protein|nr:alpha/beta fold hydrolase [Thermoanaerobaculia bacterium]